MQVVTNYCFDETLLKMKKSDSVSNVAPNSILDSTPLNNPRNKHSDLSPLKKKNKTLKYSEEEDVHSANSQTPPSPKFSGKNASPPRVVVYPFSPYSSSCSEDSAPDVIWDYTSPTHPTDAPREERKMTIADLLNNINYQTPKQCMQSSYDEFLENWTSNHKNEVLESPKQQVKIQRKPRKCTQRFDEMLKLMESFCSSEQILEVKQDSMKVPENEVSSAVDNTLNKNESLCNTKAVEECNGKSIVSEDADSSIDELWGDVFEDDTFVKATQLLEQIECGERNPPRMPSENLHTDLSIRSIVDETWLPLQSQTSDHISWKATVFQTDSINGCQLKGCHNQNNLDGYKSSLEDVLYLDSVHIKENKHDTAEYYSGIKDKSLIGFGHELNSSVSVDYVESFCEKSKSGDPSFIVPLSSKNFLTQKNKFLKASMESGSVEPKHANKIVNSAKHNNLDFIQSHPATIPKREWIGIKKNVDLELNTFHHDDAILFQKEKRSLFDKTGTLVPVHQICSAEEIAQKKQEALKRRKQSQLLRKASSIKGKTLMH